MVCVVVSRYMEVIELMQEELVLRMDLFRRIEKALVFLKEKVMRSAIDDLHDGEGDSDSDGDMDLFSLDVKKGKKGKKGKGGKGMRKRRSVPRGPKGKKECVIS